MSTSPPSFPERVHIWGAVARKRLLRTLMLYGLVFLGATGLLFGAEDARAHAVALGLILPGGGFLNWAAPGGGAFAPHVLLAAASFACFIGALAIWFATGNFLLPFVVWLGAAAGAALCGDATVWAAAAQIVPVATIIAFTIALIATLIAGRRGLRKRAAANAYLASVDAGQIFAAAPARDNELSPADLRLLRLLLDRALQPVDAFDGFEWVDQFQTAAVRYQINFISYALSMAQATRLPAFQAYVSQAQRRLALKQLDHRVWRYWRCENLWGNFAAGADPIPRDNIMFTGFLATQLALHQAASGAREFDAPQSLAFHHPSGESYRYDLPTLVQILSCGFRDSEFGLLACEPNWIYPLCNLISACAVLTQDAALWNGFAPRFRERLESDFIAPDGSFIPFLSAYTGIAAPSIGGAVMQAFPCFFLSALAPDLAQRQWLMARRRLGEATLRRALWPIDVGNYRWSRASSYAATAAAAVELGDEEIARRMLCGLEEECPIAESDGVAHRPRASLWAHAVELMARCGEAGSLRRLARAPRPLAREPHIAQASYPDVLAAKATAANGALRAVLYPGRKPGPQRLTIAGLDPHRLYRRQGSNDAPIAADSRGEACLDVMLNGRFELLFHPLA